MKRHIIFHFLSLVFLVQVLTSTSILAQRDTLFVKESKEKFTLGINTRYRNQNISIKDLQGDLFNADIENIQMGIRVRYAWLNVAASIPVYTLSPEGSYSPAASSLSIRLTPYNWLVHSNTSYISELDLHSLRGDAWETIMANDKIFMTNLYAANILGGEKMSLSGSYSFVNPQKKSTGSWVMAIEADYLLYDYDRRRLDSLGLSEFGIDQFQRVLVSLQGGFTASYVYKGLVLNALVTSGIYFGYQVFDFVDQKEVKDNALTSNLGLRTYLSAVYHFPKSFYLGITLENIPNANQPMMVEIDVINYHSRLSFGKLF